MNSKSLSEYLQGLYDAILLDCVAAYPSRQKEFERDKVRLHHLMKHRGFQVLTLDFPELGKHLDRCLSRGSYTKSGMVATQPYTNRGPIPKLFRGLYLRVFHPSGMLREDCDVTAIKLLRQLFYAAKKLKLECTNERIWKQIRSFYTVDRQLPSPTLKWDEDELGEFGKDSLHLRDYHPNRPADLNYSLFPEKEEGMSDDQVPSDIVRSLYHIQDVADYFTCRFGWFNPSDWRAKHGPGAVSDQARCSKYEFPTWPRKLDRVFPLADFAYANYGQWSNDLLESGMSRRFSENEPPSRLICVPKTAKGPRLIAAEPTAHQWCQQMVLKFLTRGVENSFLQNSISFRDQEPSRESARQASRADDRWTIDLSAASDRLSCRLVERIFRSNKTLLNALSASRTRWIEQSIDRESPKFYKLKKFSTMGSACTFPVQSILFAIIAIGVGFAIEASPSRKGTKSYLSLLEGLSKKVRVFGDDIIVPKSWGPLLMGVLRYLSLEVNLDKTFGTGKFRESCGMDAYDGTDVTSTSILTYPEWSRPESIISSIATRNNLLRSGLFASAAWMKSRILSDVRGLRIPEVPVDSGLLGWETYEPTCNDGLRKRVNTALQIVECLVHRVKTRVEKIPDRGSSSLLQYFTEDPDPQTKWSAGWSLRPKAKLSLGWVSLSPLAG